MSKEEKVLLSLNSDCKKLHFLDSVGYDYAFQEYIYELSKLTGHTARFTLDGLGAHYSHDSIFKNDIKLWEKLLNCDP